MSDTRQKPNVVVPGRAYWRVAFLLVLLAMLYLSLMPSLSVVLEHRLPHWLGRWAGAHDFLANLLAFGALAFTALMGFGPPAEAGQAANHAPAFVLVGIVVFAGALELVQYRFLPQRYCDWRDVVAAGVGAGLAVVVYGRKKRTKAKS